MSWLIYKHVNNTNGKVYIGQSKYSWEKINDRWQNGRGYGIKTRIGMAIAKYGWENFSHELIEDNIESQEKANEREIYWINIYSSYSEGYNSIIGGKNISNEMCFKLKVYCINNQTLFSSITEASQVLNFARSKRYRQLTTRHYYKQDNYIFCLEREKDNFEFEYYKVKYNHESIKRDIICVETGEIFYSIIECAIATGISTQNLSQNCCINHRTAKQKHYAYLEEYENGDWIPAEEYDTNRRKEASSLKKEVYCFQTNTFYKSATEAAETLKIPIRSVTRCAKEDGDLIQTHGYNFCYREDWYEGWTPRDKKTTTYQCTDKTREKMRNSNRCKPVLCVETNTVYRSTKEAERKTGISSTTIGNCCNKKPHNITAGGFHWEYIVVEA